MRLVCGGSFVVVREKQKRNPDSLHEYLKDFRVGYELAFGSVGQSQWGT